MTSTFQEVQLAPAAWYPDPTVAASLRYWDGRKWTDHRAAIVNPQAPTKEPKGRADQNRFPTFWGYIWRSGSWGRPLAAVGACLSLLWWLGGSQAARDGTMAESQGYETTGFQLFIIDLGLIVAIALTIGLVVAWQRARRQIQRSEERRT